MQVEVVYHDGLRPRVTRVSLPEGGCVRDALLKARIDERQPDFASAKVGVFGKIKKPDTPLRDGDRIELYQPITADPETVPRRDQ